MRRALTFDQIVGLADGLSLPQKESLVEIISRRLADERRTVLRGSVRDANRDFKAGKCRVTTAAQLMKDITG